MYKAKFIKNTHAILGNHVPSGTEMEGVLVDGLDIDFKFVDLHPIPLTDEWFLRFGFIQNEHSGNYWESDEWNELYFVAGELYFEFDSKRIASCKTVHQLQNLYFALIGQELQTA